MKNLVAELRETARVLTELSIKLEGFAFKASQVKEPKKQASNDLVQCLICAQTGVETWRAMLTKHIERYHGVPKVQYLKMFKDAKLCSDAVVAQRRETAKLRLAKR